MKKRILLAITLSLLAHWLILGLNWSFWEHRRSTTPRCRSVTITMSYPEFKKSAALPKPEKRNIRKPEIMPRKETGKKEITHPDEVEQETLEPVSSHAEAVETEKTGAEAPEDTISGNESTKGDESEKAVVQEAIPRYRDNPPPVYPRLARRRGHQGTVLLEVLVDQTGGVRDLRVLQSSGYTTLDDAALESVQNWSFEPGTKRGQPVEMWVRLPVRFHLK